MYDTEKTLETFKPKIVSIVSLTYFCSEYDSRDKK